MIYRLANEKDFKSLAHLRWEFRLEDDGEHASVAKLEFVEKCVEFLKRGSASGYHAYWIAEEAGEIVSQIFVHMIDMVPRPCNLEDRFGYITNNYTKPQFRNRGIGSELLKKVVEWSHNEDLELLIVYPSELALPFYQRSGFTMENEVMELRLRDFYSPAW
jgi:ribosomal protein S18 acetylase RimI-like enzyme